MPCTRRDTRQWAMQYRCLWEDSNAHAGNPKPTTRFWKPTTGELQSNGWVGRVDDETHVITMRIKYDDHGVLEYLFRPVQQAATIKAAHPS